MSSIIAYSQAKMFAVMFSEFSEHLPISSELIYLYNIIVESRLLRMIILLYLKYYIFNGIPLPTKFLLYGCFPMLLFLSNDVCRI